jgi:hypothetical protein
MQNYTKYCYDCTETKPAEEFHKSKATNDGLQRYCKVCTLKKHADYRKRTNNSWWKRKEGMPYSVYTITNPVGETYIGFTGTSTKLRWQRHVAQYIHKKSNIPGLYKSFDTYGVGAHKFEVVGEYETEILARQAESKLIIESFKVKKGLNEILSALPVAQYNKNTGELIKNWNSVGEASAFFKQKSSWIYSSIRGYKNVKTAFGYVWKILPLENGTVIDYNLIKGYNIEEAK